MTIREFVDVIDAGITVDVEKGGETVAEFDVAYVDSIIDEILDTEIGHIAIDSAYRGSTTVTITEDAEDTEPGEEEPDDDGDDGDGNDGDGNDGDEGGDTEPDDENP